MTRVELDVQRTALRRMLNTLDAVKVECRTCIAWAGATCEKYGPPPADVVSVGCDEWQFDDIPF
jgi:hypothetical protein